jgi:hypothetical protein
MVAKLGELLKWMIKGRNEDEEGEREQSDADGRKGVVDPNGSG